MRMSICRHPRGGARRPRSIDARTVRAISDWHTHLCRAIAVDLDLHLGLPGW
jgi:hypothetical protein